MNTEKNLNIETIFLYVEHSMKMILAPNEDEYDAQGEILDKVWKAMTQQDIDYLNRNFQRGLSHCAGLVYKRPERFTRTDDANAETLNPHQPPTTLDPNTNTGDTFMNTLNDLTTFDAIEARSTDESSMSQQAPLSVDAGAGAPSGAPLGEQQTHRCVFASKEEYQALRAFWKSFLADGKHKKVAVPFYGCRGAIAGYHRQSPLTFAHHLTYLAALGKDLNASYGFVRPDHARFTSYTLNRKSFEMFEGTIGEQYQDGILQTIREFLATKK